MFHYPSQLFLELHVLLVMRSEKREDTALKECMNIQVSRESPGQKTDSREKNVEAGHANSRVLANELQLLASDADSGEKPIRIMLPVRVGEEVPDV